MADAQRRRGGSGSTTWTQIYRLGRRNAPDRPRRRARQKILLFLPLKASWFSRARLFWGSWRESFVSARLFWRASDRLPPSRLYPPLQPVRQPSRRRLQAGRAARSPGGGTPAPDGQAWRRKTQRTDRNASKSVIAGERLNVELLQNAFTRAMVLHSVWTSRQGPGEFADRCGVARRRTWPLS